MSGADLPFGIETTAKPQRELFDAEIAIDKEGPHQIEVGIPMRDGVELAAMVHLPAAQHRPAPTILHGTPYGKLEQEGEGIKRRVEAGYALVFYDTRGRGASEGEWQPLSMVDAYDGHDAVEWVAEQEWCSGAVGAEGLSYDGWITMATVSQQPPHLKAAIPFSAAGRWQEEIPYMHGCFQLFFVWWWAMVRRRIMDQPEGVVELLDLLPVDEAGKRMQPAGPGWREFMEHETLDELWRSRRWDGRYDFDVPCLHVTGWHDREDLTGAFHHYEEMIEHSPARERQWLLVGPWSHVSTRWPSPQYAGVTYPEASLDMTAIELRFFDHFLKGEDNGVDDEPRVRIYDPGAGSWQTRPAWRGETREFELFLGPDERLLGDGGAEGEDSYRYDPMEPNGLRYPIEVLPLEPPLDLAEFETQDGVIGWTSEPLGEDVTVRGWGELELWAASDREDTEWYAKIADVDPDGKCLWVGWGCLRASFGEDPRNPAALTPNEPRRYAIELTPTFHTWQAGHRFRVLLSSSEFPWFARNMNRFEPIAKQSEPLVATNTVFYGAATPSRLRLQVE